MVEGLLTGVEIGCHPWSNPILIANKKGTVPSKETVPFSIGWFTRLETGSVDS